MDKSEDRYDTHLASMQETQYHAELASMQETQYHAELASRYEGSYSETTQPLSSGRWDAAGNWGDAVSAECEKSLKWASSLDASELHLSITQMASDTNSFTLYERRALLQVVALKLSVDIDDNLQY